MHPFTTIKSKISFTLEGAWRGARQEFTLAPWENYWEYTAKDWVSIVLNIVKSLSVDKTLTESAAKHSYVVRRTESGVPNIDHYWNEIELFLLHEAFTRKDRMKIYIRGFMENFAPLQVCLEKEVESREAESELSGHDESAKFDVFMLNNFAKKTVKSWKEFQLLNFEPKPTRPAFVKAGKGRGFQTDNGKNLTAKLDAFKQNRRPLGHRDYNDHPRHGDSRPRVPAGVTPKGLGAVPKKGEHQTPGRTATGNGERSRLNLIETRTCNFCGKKGHLMSSCRYLTKPVATEQN